MTDVMVSLASQRRAGESGEAVQTKEMSGGEELVMAEPVQEAPHQMGEGRVLPLGSTS
jgi:hypothetical protein